MFRLLATTLGLLLAASGGLVMPAQAAQLQRLSVQETPESTRAVLELSGATDYKVFTLANPHRLVVDLRGSALASGFKAPGPNGVVLDVRTGKPADNELRVVFDLAAPVRPRSQIERVGVQTRLVLDLLDGDKTAASAPKTVQDVVGNGERKLIVAIDAGHGGKDPGAIGPSGKREKDITLAMARELARQIDADPGLEAVLIRDRDEFIPLQQRYMRARAAQADLFISLHADAAHNKAAAGASVYVLSLRGASSEAARWLADQENAADLVGGVELDLSKDKHLAAVLLDLSQSATMRISDDVANQVLAEMTRVGKAHKPQVERANFVVLRSPDVPSMLVETGFISNPAEEAKLSDPKYRERLATAIVGGVRNYFAAQPPPGTWYAARQGQLPGSRLHVVSRGETLSLIAARHGVPLASIREANRIQGDVVRIGERLTIPLPAAPQ